MRDPKPRQIAQKALEAARVAIDTVIDAEAPVDRRELFREWVYDYVQTAAAIGQWPGRGSETRTT